MILFCIFANPIHCKILSVVSIPYYTERSQIVFRVNCINQNDFTLHFRQSYTLQNRYCRAVACCRRCLSIKFSRSAIPCCRYAPCTPKF